LVQAIAEDIAKPRIARALTGITVLKQNIYFSDIHLVDIASNLSDGYPLRKWLPQLQSSEDQNILPEPQCLL